INQKELKIAVDCEPTLQILAEPNLFQIIMLNIIQNAIKYSPHGKQIHIFTSPVQTGNNKFISIAIKDEAGGISRDILDSILNPLRSKKTGKNLQEGFHLGLYLVKVFTKSLNGKIKIDSRKGLGTTIVLTFPCVAGYQPE
ncbi:MAG: ATP-binding protein, partial [bacterium]